MARGAALRAVALALAAMAVLATHDVVIKVMGQRHAPLQTLFFVALFGLPMVLAVQARGPGPLRQRLRLRPAHPGWVALRSLAMVIAAVAGMQAFALLPLAETYALLFTMPLWVTLLAMLLLGEGLRPLRVAGMVLGLAGVLIVLDLRSGSPIGLGHGAALASAFGSALAGVIGRRLGAGERASVLLFWPMLGNLALGAAAIGAVWTPMPAADLGLAVVIAALNLIGSALLLAAFRAGEAALVAPMQYSQIVWAVAYGALLFGDRIGPRTLVGIALIVVAGLLSMTDWPRRRAPAQKPRTGAA